jgi:hypothetical protein
MKSIEQALREMNKKCACGSTMVKVEKKHECQNSACPSNGDRLRYLKSVKKMLRKNHR